MDYPEPTILSDALLRAWPLPRPHEGGDKDDRGSVLIAGGAVEVPGAIILAGMGALRAGAGKLQLATCRSHAAAVGVAVPEALVAGLPESPAGEIDLRAAPEIARRAVKVRALLVGPGMVDNDEAGALLSALLPLVGETGLVVDAGALACLSVEPAALHGRAGSVILTPHAGEMATMLGISKEEVTRDPPGIARRAAAAFQAVVALKGSETYIAAPDGTTYCNRHGTVGLATSGSGDSLSGIIAGLLARGATAQQATCWGVYLHASAGNRLARRMGTLGFLAREIPAEIPPLLMALAPGQD